MIPASVGHYGYIRHHRREESGLGRGEGDLLPLRTGEGAGGTGISLAPLVAQNISAQWHARCTITA